MENETVQKEAIVRAIDERIENVKSVIAWRKRVAEAYFETFKKFVAEKLTVDGVAAGHLDSRMNLLEAMDKCFSAWYNSEEGSKAWEYTCEDLNIGDALSGMRPSNEFTRQFGFEFLPDDFDNVIEIEYDRVFGRPETDMDDDSRKEHTLAVEQLCESCVRTFPSLQPFFETDSAEWLKND